jgi:nucleotide-binding universal stress UspA family protein
VPTTVLHLDYASAVSPPEGEREAERTKVAVSEGAKAGKEAAPAEPGKDRVEITTRVEEPDEAAIVAEAKKGYDLLFIGREPASEGDTFHEQITASAVGFGGPFAIAIARGIDREQLTGIRLKILVPVTGTAVSRQGAELAIALAQASRGRVTALHVADGQRKLRSWRRQFGAAIAPMSSGEAIIREIVRLGDHYGVEVRGMVRHAENPQDAILRQLKIGDYNLLVLGVSPRPGEQLSFGRVPAELLDRAECSVLFVAAEAPAPITEERRARTGHRHPEREAAPAV